MILFRFVILYANNPRANSIMACTSRKLVTMPTEILTAPLDLPGYGKWRVIPGR
jgi:hypothetical protein